MKATNEKIRIQLQHAVTGKMYEWKFKEHSVPAQSYLAIRIEDLRTRHSNLVEKHNLPKDEDGYVDFKQIDKPDVVEEMIEINRKILKHDMDRLSMVVELSDPLPDGYENQRELLEECIGSYEVIPKLMSVFMERSGSITSSPGRGTSPIRFLRPNGEEYDPFKEMKTETKVKEQEAIPE